jgi:hypothetical protein
MENDHVRCSHDDVVCSACGRLVVRQLLCVDSTTGEMLCPVHYRARHFSRVLAAQKSERRSTPAPRRKAQHEDKAAWSLPSHPQVLSALDQSNTALGGNALPDRYLGGDALTTPAAATYYSGSQQLRLLSESPLLLPTPSGGMAPMRSPSHFPAAFPLVDHHAAAHWAAQLAAVERSERASQRLIERAAHWHAIACSRRAFRRLRAHRSGASLAGVADGLLVGRAFAQFLSRALMQALHEAESGRLYRTLNFRRGLTAFANYKEVAWSLHAANSWRRVRGKCAALAVLRWNASLRLAMERSGVHRQHERTRLRQWLRSARRLARAHDARSQRAATAELRFRLSAQLACLRRWRSLTRIALLSELEADVALQLACKQKLRRGWKRWLTSEVDERFVREPTAPVPQHELSVAEPDVQQQTVTTMVREAAGGSDPRSHSVSENLERRAVDAMRRAEQAEARVVQLEQALMESEQRAAQALAAAARESERLTASFRRERDTLLRELGMALERSSAHHVAALPGLPHPQSTSPADDKCMPAIACARRRRLVRVIK